jgi:rhodanese-related sulfurtransferase
VHNGTKIRIERNQDNENIIDLDYALTSRPCPPYCIQPVSIHPDVETVGELEVLQYLKRMSEGDNSILLIDSREQHWLAKGMIPGAINIPWTRLHNRKASPAEIADIMHFQFNAVRVGDLWTFENSRTLVLYCNGPWCGQSSTNIRALINFGYPANKLKWYRGGMQNWKALGLTTMLPDQKTRDK